MGKVVRAGVGRRRVQTFAMALTTMLAVTASVLAAGLLVASQAPFDHAFARQRGAHLTIQFDPQRASAAQVAATAHVPGVTAAAGPYPVLSLRPHVQYSRIDPVFGDQGPPMTVVGRPDAGGPVDRLDLVAGSWATRTGQVVLDPDRVPFGIGDRVSFPDSPGNPTLTVVGLARSIGDSAGAWVSPAQLAALTPAGTAPAYQMLYRFTAAATDAQITADRAAVAAAVPPGALAGVVSYLTVKQSSDQLAATFVPFVTAFGVLALGMSVLIIGVVVGGAVASATRRIGILKALGFTPAQVARAYLGQALFPAAIGAALGVGLGNLAAVPALAEARTAYGAGTLAVAPWIDVTVPVAALVAVLASALAPALRAGRLRAVEALAVGRTPQVGRGRRVRYLLGRVRLPRPVSLGLANPFARPARALTMLVALVLGAAGVTFGTGLALSLGDIQQGLNRRDPGAVTVRTVAGPQAPVAPPAGAAPGPGAGTGRVGRGPAGGASGGQTVADPAAVATAIRAQPGTGRYFGTGRLRVGVPGLAGSTTVIAFQGDSSWGSYQMISGSWFHAPGEAVVPSGFLDTTGTHLGDTITLASGGHQVRVRIVGEVLDLQEQGMIVMTDEASLAALHTPVPAITTQFFVDLRPGTGVQGYVDSLNAVLQPLGAAAQSTTGRVSNAVIAMDTLAATMTLMLVAVAGLGVLNTVVLDVRERVHDLGVFKALGMSPRQTLTMVVSSVAGVGLLAGAVGVPVGVLMHGWVLPLMGRAAGTRIPAVDIAVYHAALLAPLLLGGLVIAIAGALLPAGWAARTRTATALRTE